VVSSTSLSLAWDSGLGLSALKSQARSIDAVAVRSPMGSPHEIQCPFGLGSGLWRQESAGHPGADPSKPLQQQGVGTPRLARGDKLHHKFAVIGQRKVITGSFNWSPSAAHTNDETLLVIHSPQLAQHFTREMDRLWDGAELGITPHIQGKINRQKIRCGGGEMRS
jgi:hypothetical protein